MNNKITSNNEKELEKEFDRGEAKLFIFIG